MKKVLLSMLAATAMLFAISQTLPPSPYPCVQYFATGNLGGGDCPTTGTGGNKYYPGYTDSSGANQNYTPTGKITLYFASPIPIGTPAPIITAAGIDNGDHLVHTAFDYLYVPYHDNPGVARTSVVYCYYGSASNQNIFNGSKAPKLAFRILYYGYLSNTCGNVTPVPVTLPVLFQSFSATRSSQSVSIKWETATEINNRGFYVQRNVNGEWKDIAFVFSKADDGNSNQPLSYSYNDPNPLSSVSYYRVLQVDLDGRGKFSETRIVKGLAEVNKILMFPNPGSNGKINLLFQDEVAPKNIMIYDATGRAVKSFKNVLSANLTVDQLRPGIYNIQVINTSTQVISSDKFIIKD
jgi:hypothetical protein